MASWSRSSRTSSGRKRAMGLKMPRRIFLSNSPRRSVGMFIVTVVLQCITHTEARGPPDAREVRATQARSTISTTLRGFLLSSIIPVARYRLRTGSPAVDVSFTYNAVGQRAGFSGPRARDPQCQCRTSSWPRAALLRATGTRRVWTANRDPGLTTGSSSLREHVFDPHRAFARRSEMFGHASPSASSRDDLESSRNTKHVTHITQSIDSR